MVPKKLNLQQRSNITKPELNSDVKPKKGVSKNGNKLGILSKSTVPPSTE